MMDLTDKKVEFTEDYWRDREHIIQEGGRSACHQAFIEGWATGSEAGSNAGLCELVTNLLEVRFGEDAEDLYGIVESLVQLPKDELAHALLYLSREELLARVGGHNP